MSKLKNQKGITLVALVITIIILIILAGITISIVLGEDGLIAKAKGGAENYQKAATAEQKLLDDINAFLDGQTSTISSGTGGSGTHTPQKTTYTVGETVTLGGETFYVIEDSDSSTTTVKLLAALNVMTTEGHTNRYIQSANANTLRFAEESNDYETSQIKPHVDAYKAAVEGRMGSGKTIEEARLMTKEEVIALGGDANHNSSAGCTGTTAFVNATNYWLGSPNTSSNYEYCVNGEGKMFYTGNVRGNGFFGLRPVIVVLKSYLDAEGSSTTVTYTTYTVGQTLTLGGENFYVIEDSYSIATTVKLLAALNVMTTEGHANRYKQDADANTLAFDDDSNDYATSEIKGHVDAYKAAVEGRMGAGKTIQEARLMTKEEVVALGGDIADETTSGCTGTTAFVNTTNYWLGSPNESKSNYEWRVSGENEYLDDSNVSNYYDYGLRPVLVILKSNI